jgi:hypothetical protein
MSRSALVLAILVLGVTGCPCDPEKPGTICTIAGEGSQGYGGDDGPATKAYLNVPQDMAVSPDGEIWLLDFNNYLIRAVDVDGRIRTVAGTGLLGNSPPNGEGRVPALEALFNHTTDLFFQDGFLYLAAWHNSGVKRIDLTTMELEQYAGRGIRTLYDGDGGPALAAALDLPSSIASDPEGNLVIMDQANQVIRRVDQDGVIDRVAGVCVVDGDQPCLDGEMPVACPNGNKFACGDPEYACYEACTPSYAGDGGPCLDLRMAQPFGQMADPAGRLAFTPDGDLIFADSNNHRLRRIDTDGVVTTLAGTGVPGYSGDGGPAEDAELQNPVDVEVADDGSIWFTDTYNNCVRRIDGDGVIETMIGQCSTDTEDRGFAGDGGPPEEALLDRPYGIELDGDRVIVADSYNQRIRVANFEE